MTHESRYEIKSQPIEEPPAHLNIRLTLYDRALKRALFEFLAMEKLSIEKTTLDDGFIDYEIACIHYRSLFRLEQMLRNATQM